MTEITNWDALRQLRLSGKKPSLPIIVTSKNHLPRRLEGVGCFAILHQAGETPPVKLLDGLDVIFWFDTCALAGRFVRYAENRGVKFERTRAWCKCGSMLTLLAIDCESHAAAVEWFERPKEKSDAA
jgi:hypothetical protein